MILRYQHQNPLKRRVDTIIKKKRNNPNNKISEAIKITFQKIIAIKYIDSGNRFDTEHSLRNSFPTILLIHPNRVDN